MYRIAGLGLEIESELPRRISEAWQRFLGIGTTHLFYRVSHAELPKQPGQPYYADARVRCYRTELGSLRIYSDCYTHRDTVAIEEKSCCDERIDFEITVSPERFPWGVNAEQLYEVLDLPHYLLRLGRLLLHGAYVLYEGMAIIFTAPSGVGKSTQAELWRKHCGAEIINGDRTLLSFEDDRLMAHGFPFSGSSEYCRNVSAPVAVIVSLAQSKENCLEPLHGRRAIHELMRGVHLPPEDPGDMALQVDFLTQLLKIVPVYRLACLPDESAVELLRSYL